MPRDLKRVLLIEVPVKVVIAERQMRLKDIVDLMPGTIIELPKTSDEELELVVNNKTIGCGSAVKLGENFGIKISFIGDIKDRIEALASRPTSDSVDDDPDAALAEALLAGQL